MWKIGKNSNFKDNLMLTFNMINYKETYTYDPGYSHVPKPVFYQNNQSVSTTFERIQCLRRTNFTDHFVNKCKFHQAKLHLNIYTQINKGHNSNGAKFHVYHRNQWWIACGGQKVNQIEPKKVPIWSTQRNMRFNFGSLGLPDEICY